MRTHYSSGIIVLCSLTLLFQTGCKKKDKISAEDPVKVNVQIMRGTDNGYGVSGASYSGTVGSENESLLSFSRPGTITHIYVKEGQKVAKGQTIAKIKSENLAEENNNAESELEKVRDQYIRMKKLHDQNALPEVKWVEIQSKLRQAENAVTTSKKSVGETTITAPIAGYITEKMADEGQSILASQPVVKIVDSGHLQVVISVPEESFSRFGGNMDAHVFVDALNGESIDGKLSQKDVVAHPLTHSYDVRFNISNPGEKIHPGMMANVEVSDIETIGENYRHERFTVPSQSVLLNSDSRLFVWVVENGKAAKKFVIVNDFRTEEVSIESGLATGDTIIVAGMQKLRTGTPVRPGFTTDHTYKDRILGALFGLRARKRNELYD